MRISDGLSGRVKRAARLAESTYSVGSRMVMDRLAESRMPSDLDPSSSDRFLAAAYFSADTSSQYQIEQWLWPFEKLASNLRESGFGPEPFGILVRNASVARTLREKTTLPVRFSRLSSGLDRFMSSESLRIVFYVNQATGNFQALKFPRPAHVHLSHGESEKISMISNQLKAYDFVFTAGPAARSRISNRLIGLSEERMIDVGRPQLDRPWSVPEEWKQFDSTAPSGRTVFYAPTWEGDSPAMAYGTLAQNGEDIVRSLLDSGHRVIFRPHPRTGVLKKDFAAALEAVEELLTADPRGFVDRSPDVSWQFDIAEVALAEMSSVAFDWLATLKPLVMIEPQPSAEVLAGGLLNRCPVVTKGYEGSAAAIIDDVVDSGAWNADISSDYLGDTTAGAQILRFVAGCKRVSDERNREWEIKNVDSPQDPGTV